MKTIQFTGTENEIINLSYAMGLADNSLPVITETKVFVIEKGLYEGDYSDMSDEDFKEVAELEGRVYSLNDFKDIFNQSFSDSLLTTYDDIATGLDIIRFINVEV